MVPNLTNPAITHEQIVATVVPNGTVPQASTVGSMTPGGHEGMFTHRICFIYRREYLTSIHYILYHIQIFVPCFIEK